MALLTMVILLSPTSALAEIIHVPAEYPTIQEGIDAAVSGDVVMVAAGIYLEEITLKAGVAVLGAGEGQSIIDGGGNSGDVVRAIGNDITNDTQLQGFTITGAISGGSMPGGGGIFCNSGASPDISNNRIEGNDTGIATWNNSSAVIHNNVVVDNTYTGVALSSGSAVTNNTIANNNIGIYDSGGYRPTIMNNIITTNTTYGIGCVNSSVPTDISYNDVWGNGTDYRYCYAGVGDISADPEFSYEPGGDYHLATGSPCINAGNPLPAFNDPDGSRNDMGAYGGPAATSGVPEVSLTIPAPNQLEVSTDTDVSAIFSVEMDAGTLSGQTFVLQGLFSGTHPGTVTYDPLAMMVTTDPDDGFMSGELVTALLARGIRAATGDSLPGFAWQFTCGTTGGSGQYAAAAHHAAGTDPEAVVTGDFDADGHLDLAAAVAGESNLSVRLGAGDGSFGAAVSFATGTGPAALCTADFDGDGHLDLATANAGSNDLSILLGDGAGNFATASHYPAGTQPAGLCTGDFDLDGVLDLAVANFVDETVAILPGLGGGGFGPPTAYAVGGTARSVSSGDFDGDGVLDLAVANASSNTISILLGAGNGAFGSTTHYVAGSNPYGLCPGDFDGDGVLDLACASHGSNIVSVLLGSGSGSFLLTGLYATGTSPYAVTTADLDGDGSLDLAVVNAGSGDLSILLGNGNGTFDPASSYTAGLAPHSICGGDFDHDGDFDLATANATGDDLSVLLNENDLTVTTTSPAGYELGVPRTTDAASTFSLDLNPATLNSASFLLYGRQSGGHTGVVSYDGSTFTATLDPTTDLVAGEMVTATLTNAIEAANAVTFGGYAWSFTAAVGVSSAGTFDDLQHHAAGTEPRGVAAADFDGDGDIDLAAGCSNYPSPGTMALLLNNGDGSFASPAFYGLGAPDPLSVYAGDVDGDGDIDLATAHNEPGTSHLVVLKNNGNAIFTLAGTYAPAILGQSIAGGDVDADGDLDLVMTDGWGSNNNVKVMFNNGNGSFGGMQTYSAGTWARGVVIEDVDRDGDLDLAVTNAGNDNVSILLGDGAGLFPMMVNYPIGPNPGALFGNDFDGDGSLDLVAGGTDQLSVILNQGDGTFSAPVSYSTGGTVRGIVGGDLDGDGDIDLAASRPSANMAWVILNNGDGSFAGANQYTVGEYPWGLQTADLDLDGTLDLALASFDQNRMDILFNRETTGVEQAEQPIALAASSRLTIFPNPFRTSTRIAYHRPGNATEHLLGIYDVTGRLVRNIALAPGTPEIGAVIWDGRNGRGRMMPAGVYFCRLQLDDGSVTRRVLYLK